MKQLLTIYISIFFVFAAFAQDATKYQKDRASMFSSYIAEKESLSEDQELFVYNVMLERVVNANSRIKSSPELAREDKQNIYKDEYSKAQQKLAAEFGPKMARRFMQLSNEARKNADNN